MLWATWAVCAASSASAAIMVWYVSAHPLAGSDRGNLWLVYLIPYVVIAGTALVFWARGSGLILLLTCTLVAAAVGTFTRYLDLKLAISLLDTRAAGQHGMACGPPPQLFGLAVEYGLALVLAAMSLDLFPRRPGRGE